MIRWQHGSSKRVKWRSAAGIDEMKRKRLKTLDSAVIELVLAEDGQLVLRDEAMPDFVLSIPEGTHCKIIASGHSIAVSYPTECLQRAQLVGGMDEIRYAPDGPLPFDREWYPLLGRCTATRRDRSRSRARGGLR